METLCVGVESVYFTYGWMIGHQDASGLHKEEKLAIITCLIELDLRPLVTLRNVWAPSPPDLASSVVGAVG